MYPYGGLTGVPPSHHPCLDGSFPYHPALGGPPLMVTSPQAVLAVLRMQLLHVLRPADIDGRQLLRDAA